VAIASQHNVPANRTQINFASHRQLHFVPVQRDCYAALYNHIFLYEDGDGLGVDGIIARSKYADPP
jgi:hypothetical protein